MSFSLPQRIVREVETKRRRRFRVAVVGATVPCLILLAVCAHVRLVEANLRNLYKSIRLHQLERRAAPPALVAETRDREADLLATVDWQRNLFLWSGGFGAGILWLGTGSVRRKFARFRRWICLAESRAHLSLTYVTAEEMLQALANGPPGHNARRVMGGMAFLMAGTPAAALTMQAILGTKHNNRRDFDSEFVLWNLLALGVMFLISDVIRPLWRIAVIRRSLPAVRRFGFNAIPDVLADFVTLMLIFGLGGGFMLLGCALMTRGLSMQVSWSSGDAVFALGAVAFGVAVWALGLHTLRRVQRIHWERAAKEFYDFE